MTHTTVDRTKYYTPKDFKPYLKRLNIDWDNRKLLLLPNFKPIEPTYLLNLVCGHHWPISHGCIRYGNEPMDEAWGTIWHNTLQSGQWDGTGYVAVSRAWGDSAPPWCGTFMLCEHKPAALPGGNPSRGDHRLFCTECGLDMSYDSSD